MRYSLSVNKQGVSCSLVVHPRFSRTTVKARRLIGQRLRRWVNASVPGRANADTSLSLDLKMNLRIQYQSPIKLPKLEENVKGILTDNVEADSDCIVTAVFLGLAWQSGKGLQISVDPTEAKDKLPALERPWPGEHRTQVAQPEAHRCEVGQGTGSHTREVHHWWAQDRHQYRYVLDFTEGGMLKKQYTGPGAYTGMVLLDNKIKYWGSTFEYQVKGRKHGTALPVKDAAMHRRPRALVPAGTSTA